MLIFTPSVIALSAKFSVHQQALTDKISPTTASTIISSVMYDEACGPVNIENSHLPFGDSMQARSIHSLSTALKHLNVTPASQSCSIFRLPTEIRLAIYHAILIDNNDTTAILRSCRQMNMEAREVLYRRTLTFDSQAKFFAWISRSSARNLNRVRTMTLSLIDVDLDSLLEDSSCGRRTRATIWSLYHNDLNRLEQSLSALPNLSRLVVIPPQIGQSQLLKNMYRSFLAEIPKRCLRLKELEVCDFDSLLETIPELKEVRQVTFTDPSRKATIKVEPDRQELRGSSGMVSTKAKRKRSRPRDTISLE